MVGLLNYEMDVTQYLCILLCWPAIVLLKQRRDARLAIIKAGIW